MKTLILMWLYSFRVDSKLWQNLGDIPHEQAKVWYIHIVTDICPEWRNPLRTDSALLVREFLSIQLHRRAVVSLRGSQCVLSIELLQRAWTPDGESDQCTICAEAFTFLNRRHHVRCAQPQTPIYLSMHAQCTKLYDNVLVIHSAAAA